MHYNCLIVDDEKELAAATCEYLQMFDVTCSWVSSAMSCEEFLNKNTVDVILLDINLENESGFNLCKKLRQTSDVPILFISARQSDDDVLIALNIGGDDYIKKPYTLSVLLAKVKAVVRRQQSSIEKRQDCTAANVGQAVRLIPELMRVSINGEEIQLKAKEFKLFSHLYNNANRIISKDELFNAVWGDAFFSDGTLNVHIRKIREKLEEDPNSPKMIKTVWGTGYIFEI